MKVIRITLILMTIFVLGRAQIANLNFTGMRYGEGPVAHSARMLGLAGSGLSLSSGLGQAVENPALAFSESSQLRVNGGLAIRKLVEDREFPYYDSFVGFNDFGSYSFNSNYYFAPYLNLAKRLPFSFPVVVQAGVVNFRDFRYTYREEVRDPNDKTDKLIGYNWIEQKGVLRGWYLGAASKVWKNLTLGFNLSVLSGNIDSTGHIEPKVESASIVKQEFRRLRDLNITPLVVRLGAHYQVNDRLAVAATLRLPYTVEFGTKLIENGNEPISKGVEKFEYPLQIGGGMDYRFQNVLQARVLLDVYYEYWSNFKDSNNNRLNFRDVLKIKTGVEYIFLNRLPVRMGFAYGTLPENRDLSRTLLTIGTGWYFDGVRFDVAGGLSHLEFYQNDLFPDTIYGLNARTDLDRVKWSEYFVKLDVSFSLFD